MLNNFLINLISSKTFISMKSFKEAVSRFNEESLKESSYYYGHVLRQFQSLGFCDCDAEGKKICVSPPQLIVLPSKLFNEAILIGARTPRLISKLKKAVGDRVGNGVYMDLVEQKDPHYPLELPELIKITSIHENDIKEISEEVGIDCSLKQPASFTLLKYAGTIKHFQKKLDFKKTVEINWDKRIFSLERLHFSNLYKDNSKKYKLIEYTNPTDRSKIFYIYNGDLCTKVGLDWGRYVLLNLERKNILYYDYLNEKLYVPSTVSLPTVYSRAASLCSGKAPLLKNNFKGGLDYFVYSNIPDFIAEEISRKLGQELNGLNAKFI